MSNVVTNIGALLGAVYSVFSVLHLMFPNVAFFQRFGAAVRQLGPKS